MKQDHGVPALLSLFVPGLGQLVKGQWKRAVFFWGLFAVVWIGAVGLTMLIFSPDLVRRVTFETLAYKPSATERTWDILMTVLTGSVGPYLVLLYTAIWFWSVVDAYRRPVSAPHPSTAQSPIPQPRSPAPPTPSRDPVQLELPGPGTFPLAIVGESHYQQQLEAVCGGRTADGVDYRCSARLVLDEANRYDPNAVRVEIDGQHVGHLSRDDAQAYREYLDLHASGPTVGVCRAKVTGGWDRGPDDRGHFGVKLDFALYG